MRNLLLVSAVLALLAFGLVLLGAVELLTQQTPLPVQAYLAFAEPLALVALTLAVCVAAGGIISRERP